MIVNRLVYRGLQLELFMKKTREMILIALFAALTAIGAFIRIPLWFYPVPMTLQTFFVFFAGFCLSPKSAAYSQLVYVLLGLIGIPIFTKGGGIHYVTDLTFGYLLSFILISPLLSIAVRKFLTVQQKKVMFAACTLGILLLMELIGIVYMAMISGLYLGEPLTLQRACYLFAVFLPLDIVKCAAGLAISLQLKKRLPFLRT